jgi:hypothetical protein
MTSTRITAAYRLGWRVRRTAATALNRLVTHA